MGNKTIPFNFSPQTWILRTTRRVKQEFRGEVSALASHEGCLRAAVISRRAGRRSLPTFTYTGQ